MKCVNVGVKISLSTQFNVLNVTERIFVRAGNSEPYVWFARPDEVPSVHVHLAVANLSKLEGRRDCHLPLQYETRRMSLCRD